MNDKSTGGGQRAILLVGDVVGKSGRNAVRRHLQAVVKEFQVELVIVNGENAAAGIGITPPVAEELLQAGANVITSGNHIWKFKEIHPYLQSNPWVLRPANYPPGVPGRGMIIRTGSHGGRVMVINLLGRVFMDPVDCPFRIADHLLENVRLGRDVDAVIVDFHAEATSEKVAMAVHLDGRVSAVLGTHTHVPTADHRILGGGTAAMTDVGMTGCYNSVIGMTKESVMSRMLTGLPSRFEPADGEATLCGAVVVVDHRSGLARRIIPVRRGGILAETVG